MNAQQDYRALVFNMAGIEELERLLLRYLRMEEVKVQARCWNRWRERAGVRMPLHNLGGSMADENGFFTGLLYLQRRDLDPALPEARAIFTFKPRHLFELIFTGRRPMYRPWTVGGLWDTRNGIYRGMEEEEVKRLHGDDMEVYLNLRRTHRYFLKAADEDLEDFTMRRFTQRNGIESLYFYARVRLVEPPESQSELWPEGVPITIPFLRIYHTFTVEELHEDFPADRCLTHRACMEEDIKLHPHDDRIQHFTNAAKMKKYERKRKEQKLKLWKAQLKRYSYCNYRDSMGFFLGTGTNDCGGVDGVEGPLQERPRISVLDYTRGLEQQLAVIQRWERMVMDTIENDGDLEKLQIACLIPWLYETQESQRQLGVSERDIRSIRGRLLSDSLILEQHGPVQILDE